MSIFSEILNPSRIHKSRCNENVHYNVRQQTTSSCRFCSKVFCCSDCRDDHEDSKHPKPKCSLCVKENLVFKAPEEEEAPENKAELCHIIFNHLPLYCKLCGTKYVNSQDLTKAKPCSWWTDARAFKTPQTPKPLAATAPCILESHSKSDVDIIAEAAEKNLPYLTPDNQLISVENKPLLGTVDARLKQDNFDSPPELVRHTSTPMHGLTVPGQKQPNSAVFPQFMLKTPSSSEKLTFDSTGSACSRGTVSSSSGFDTKYYTGISNGFDAVLGRLSLESANNQSDNTRENQFEVEPSWQNSPSCSILKKQQQHEPMSAEVNDAERERSVMKSEVLERISRINDSSEKRVRFSDQCTPPTAAVQEATANTSAYFGENDVFFEARESLDEEPKVTEPKPTEERIEHASCSCCRRNHKNTEQSVNLPTSSIANRNNNDDNNNKGEEKKVQDVADSSIGENKKSTSSTSSRVVMMLLVEQSDSKGLSSLDLAPLINSGLKKLEESVASANNLRTEKSTEKGIHKRSGSITKFSVELSNVGRKVDHSLTVASSEKGCSNRSANILRASRRNSFVSVSDRIECFSASSDSSSISSAGGLPSSTTRQSQEVSQEEPQLADSHAVGSYKSDGIFSVVARVVRSALKKLPAVGSVTSRNLSREPIPHSGFSLGGLGSTKSSSSLSISSAEVVTVKPRTYNAAATATTASQILLRRSTASKRPRERADSSEDLQARSSPSGSSNSSRGSEVISSPAAKRHRGWYRIKAREPIARMRERQITSPRGVSLETQRFQQGSLTVGDQLVPLPSRAHQSTQTEG